MKENRMKGRMEEKEGRMKEGKDGRTKKKR